MPAPIEMTIGPQDGEIRFSQAYSPSNAQKVAGFFFFLTFSY